MNKHKMKRSSRKKGYYQGGFARTERNKARRAARMQRRKVQFAKAA